MSEHIEREALLKRIEASPLIKNYLILRGTQSLINGILELIKKQPAADVVEVVRCKDCKFATELDKHCDINRTAYKHCSLWRGDETRNVWHKYKKYYKDYSIVSLDDFCSCAERRCDT